MLARSLHQGGYQVIREAGTNKSAECNLLSLRTSAFHGQAAQPLSSANKHIYRYGGAMIFPGISLPVEHCLRTLLILLAYRIHGRNAKATRLLEGGCSSAILLLLLLYAIRDHRLFLPGAICVHPAQLGFPERHSHPGECKRAHQLPFGITDDCCRISCRLPRSSSPLFSMAISG